ncbi:hypothetical protein P364_0122345 [Paenibacillus sp. MAEPY2]|nr:hypothetical protein P364_0122345 [Paenibacillus sp. MAEPY2]KGP86965.1 hypothetical protein P363_0115195 [Paenibacillus sp. MAEPY1]
MYGTFFRLHNRLPISSSFVEIRLLHYTSKPGQWVQEDVVLITLYENKSIHAHLFNFKSDRVIEGQGSTPDGLDIIPLLQFRVQLFILTKLAI